MNNFVLQSTFIMTQKDYLKDITEIKDIMSRSTRFISLSGPSGILAGVYALAGGFIAYNLLSGYAGGNQLSGVLPLGILQLILIGLGLLVAILSVVTAYFLTRKKARKNKEKMWTPASRRLFESFLIPMLAGGIFVLLLIDRGYYGLIAPATLIFYGIALFNASKFTLSWVKYLGLSEIVLGLLSLWFFGHGLFFWMAGFGVLHIVYGTLMYFNLDRK